MKIEWLIQKDGNNTIGKNIIAAFDRSPKKAFAFITGLKDSGLEILEEGFIDTKADFNVVVAYNRKNYKNNARKYFKKFKKIICL